MGLVMRWIIDEFGSLESLFQHNQKKAQLLYDVIDASDGFYSGHAQPGDRSLMNVTFRLPSDPLTDQFTTEADQRGLCSLKGHRSVGGIRASIYNAMPLEGVTALRDFMLEFRDKNAS